MRITDVYFSGFGPFRGERTLHLNTDDERVLFLGISGSGKTTVLRGIAAMWLALGRFIQKLPPQKHDAGGIAMVLRVGEGEAVIALGERKLLDEALKTHKAAWWLFATETGFEASDADMPAFSNICLMDGDRAEGPSCAPFFITDDDVRGLWHGDANMEDEARADLIETVNRLWVGKALVNTDEGFIVRLDNGFVHSIAETSMGERRILGLCYLVCTQLKEGGILMMDEPDVHVHPSQMIGLIAALERVALKKAAQVILISHHAEVWNRYDLLGKVVVMGGAHERIG